MALAEKRWSGGIIEIVSKLRILVVTVYFWCGYSAGENIVKPSNITSCQGHTSPSSVYRTVGEAIESEYWGKLYTCLAPKDRDTILKETFVGLLIASVFNEALNKSLTPILLKHGFRINEENQWVTVEEDFENVDNKQLLYGNLHSVARQHTENNISKGSKEFKLFDIIIEGDVAHGKIRLNTDKEKTIYFKKTSGGWFISTKEQ